MNVDNRTPTWRIPTLMNGQLTYLPLQQFRGKRLVLCCVPSLTEEGASFFNSQTARFAASGSTLAVLVSHDPLLKALPIHWLKQFCLPLLTDPLQQLSRSLKLTRSLPFQRCETLFFDQQCHLNFRVIHDLNARGIRMALEMLDSSCREATPSDSPELLLDSELVQPHY